MSGSAFARAVRVSACLAIAAVVAASCKKEQETARYPQPTPTTTSTWGEQPPPTASTAPSSAPAPSPTAPSAQPTQPQPQPTQTAPAAAAAAGFPCASDADLQCPFGRCIAGRCGGCRNDADCKAGAACGQSPFGLACVPSGGSGTPAPTTTAAPTPTTPPPSSDPYASARARCLQKINEYRGKVGSAAIVERADRQACADSAAQSDATNKAPHGSFGKCAETAQNECPGWKGSVDTVLDSCLKAMFAEGPGSGPSHGHYNNMTDSGYRSVACGFHVAPDGAVWIIQDYYR